MASEKTIIAGMFATFAGYSDLEDGMEEMLQVDQRVVIISVKDDGALTVAAVSEDGERLNEDGDIWQQGENLMGDTLFITELKDIEFPEDAPVVAPDAEVELTEASINAMTGPKMDDLVSRMGIETPEGFGKMKVADKKVALVAWLNAVPEASEEAEASVADAVAAALTGAVNTEVADPVAGDTVAAPAGSEVVPMMSDSQSVAAMLASQDAVSAAKALINQEQRTLYTLGGVLKHINETGIFKSYGFEGKKGFEEFCEAELNIKYRKARYLIDIYQAFQTIGVDESELDKIGWSKAAVLARVPVDQLQANVTSLLELANTKTRDELLDHIKENYEVTSRGTSAKTTTFSFKVVEADAETVKAAIDHAKTMLPNVEGDAAKDANAAFLYMCGDWMQDAAGTDLDIDGFMELAIARFGEEAIREKLNGTQAGETAEPETTAETA